LLPQYHTLVAQVTGLRSQSDDSFKAAVDLVAKNLEFTKGAAGVDMATIDRRIEGCAPFLPPLFPTDPDVSHAQKARINSKDDIAEALETSYKRLKAQRATDDPSQTIRVNMILFTTGDHSLNCIFMHRCPIFPTISNCWYDSPPPPLSPLIDVCLVGIIPPSRPIHEGVC
jgi:hypothetical protein